VSVNVKTAAGDKEHFADSFINSMDLRTMINAFQPAPPAAVVAAANRLKFRDFLIVTLVLDEADPLPDNWIYVHSDGVKVGRIQTFRAWSPDMVPDDTSSSIGMEYFCQENDGLWAMADDDLIAQAADELEQLGLASKQRVTGGKVIRQPKAYPVYDGEYQEAVGIVLDWVDSLENFQTVGRNGLHRYNNQDHSILTAMLAAENVLGADHNLQTVNVERAYHEEFVVDKDKTKAAASA